MIGLLLKKLRFHLPNTAAYHAAFVLLIALEAITGISLIWHFFLRDLFPLSDTSLAVAGGIFTAVSVIFIAINLTGRLMCFKTQGFFYFSVALFFLLKGVMLAYNREINPWGFYILWVMLLIITMRETMLELDSDVPYE